MSSQSSPDNDSSSALNSTDKSTQPSPGFLTRLKQSSFNPDFYRTPYNESWATAIKYLLKLVLILTCIMTVSTYFQIWPSVTQLMDELNTQLPELTLDNGQWETPVDTPYRIEFSTEGNQSSEIIIDPTGSLNRDRLQTSVVAVAVNGGLYYRHPLNPDSFWLSKLPADTGRIDITPEWINSWSTTLRISLVVSLFLITLTMFTVVNGLRVVLISIGAIIARSDDQEVDWGPALKLSCYAVTPLIGIDIVSSSLGFNLPFQELLMLIGGTVWLYIIVRHLIDTGYIKYSSEDSPDDPPSDPSPHD